MQVRKQQLELHMEQQTGSVELLQVGHLYLLQRDSSMCDVLVDSSLLVAGETSPVLVGGSSVIVATGSSPVATKDLVVPV